jgi:NADPH:quinone reductase-like Zn-dependent oxidoreductase
MPDVPKTMRAVFLTGHGGLDRLELRDDVTVPEPGAGEVLVRVLASSVNNTDINTRTSWYAEEVQSGITETGAREGFEDAGSHSTGWSGAPFAFPRIQGADICGEIAAVGPGVDTRRIGERVLTDVWIRDADDPLNIEKAACIGSELDGGFAEFARLPASCAHAICSELSAEELASFPCAYTTAENLVSRGKVAEGDRVLITGASGGVGSAAIQLCKRRGAEVVAMASEGKHEALLALGADACLSRQVEDLATALAEISPVGGIDAVLDPACGPKFGELVHALRGRGRYASCGAIAGPIVTFDARDLIYGDLEFYGATIAPKSVFMNLVGYIERGEIQPVIARVFDLSELRAAQELFLQKKYVGKIAISVAS